MESKRLDNSIQSPFMLACSCGSKDVAGVAVHEYPMPDGKRYKVKATICKECRDFIVGQFKSDKP